VAISVPAAGFNATALPATSDEHLVALAARGSQRAFTELYRRHREPLYRYCHNILREHADAEDAVQVAMTRALVALESGTLPASWRAWLFGIARNQAIDQLRLRGRHEPLADAHHVAVAADDVQVEHRERLAVALADVARLPERQRSALVLRELQGLSDREIAATLAISSDGVRQAVFEARTALKDFTLGRELACRTVLELIAGDRRRLRARQVRAHLRSCPSCHAADGAARARGRTAWWLPVWLQDLALRLLAGAPETGHEALAGSTVVVKSLAAAAAATTIGIGLADRPPVSAPSAHHAPPAPVRTATARPTHRVVLATTPAARPVAHGERRPGTVSRAAAPTRPHRGAPSHPATTHHVGSSYPVTPAPQVETHPAAPPTPTSDPSPPPSASTPDGAPATVTAPSQSAPATTPAQAPAAAPDPAPAPAKAPAAQPQVPPGRQPDRVAPGQAKKLAQDPAATPGNGLAKGQAK
jgi:RNA polymerase sigma factor (sigma-70 family)